MVRFKEDITVFKVMYCDCDCTSENGRVGIVFVDGTPSTIPTTLEGGRKVRAPVVWIVVFVAYYEDCVGILVCICW